MDNQTPKQPDHCTASISSVKYLNNLNITISTSISLFLTANTRSSLKTGFSVAGSHNWHRTTTYLLIIILNKLIMSSNLIYVLTTQEVPNVSTDHCDWRKMFFLNASQLSSPSLLVIVGYWYHWSVLMLQPHSKN